MIIKVAFYKKDAPNADWVDKIIAWWTKGPYSHTELIIDNYMYSTSPRDGKVRVKPHKYDPQSWEYYEIEVNDVNNIKQFFNQTKNLPYDWMGIIGFILPLQDRTNKWFCSEWVSNALKINSISKLFKYEPSKISPNKLYELLTDTKFNYNRLLKIPQLIKDIIKSIGHKSFN